MVASENAPRRGARRKIIFLFLPTTLSAWLALFGFILAMIAFMFPFVVRATLEKTGVVLLLAAFVAAIWGSLQRKGHRMVSLYWTLVKMIGVIAAFFVIFELGDLLAFMAAGGSGSLNLDIFEASQSSQSSQGSLGSVEDFLLLFIVVLLVWIPQVFFRIQLDMSGTGKAQRVLLTLITVASCIMTGIFILLLHFGDGPLGSVKVGVLVIGAIGTMLLVAPPYRAVARLCWQHGLSGAFSLRALKQHWTNVLTEIGKALPRAAEHDMSSSSIQPSASPRRRNRRDRVVLWAFVGAVAGIIAIMSIGFFGSGAEYYARAVSFKAVNPADLSVTILVFNSGSKSATPACAIWALDSSYTTIGVRFVTLPRSVAPGASATSVVNLTILKQGAIYVTQVTVRCVAVQRVPERVNASLASDTGSPLVPYRIGSWTFSLPCRFRVGTQLVHRWSGLVSLSSWC
jgi:hypothetical protein